MATISATASTRISGFTAADRVENIRRTGEIAKLMMDAGLIVICSLISPFRADRLMVRQMVGERSFVEVFVDTPLEVCQQRDPKGLYKRALAGELLNFTGVTQPYERPLEAEITIRWEGRTAEDDATLIMSELHRLGIFESE